MSSIPSPDLSDRTPVHRHHVDGFGEVRLVPVDPDADLDLLYAWVTEERAKFWGMTGHTREEVHETYTFLDGLTTHHAFLAVLGGRPAALFQTYEPEADPLGECYDVQPGDHGVHLLIGPAHGGQPVANFSSGLIIALIDYVLTDPAAGGSSSSPTRATSGPSSGCAGSASSSARRSTSPRSGPASPSWSGPRPRPPSRPSPTADSLGSRGRRGWGRVAPWTTSTPSRTST